MITRISGPLTKWLKIIKGQATPAFPVPFVPRKRKKKKKVSGPAELSQGHGSAVLFLPAEGQSATTWHPGSNSILFRDCVW